MAKIIEDRKISELILGDYTVYFLDGPHPKPKILIDDIEGFVYVRIGLNAMEDAVYRRRGLD